MFYAILSEKVGIFEALSAALFCNMPKFTGLPYTANLILSKAFFEICKSNVTYLQGM
jgi:hypothetical protein